MTVLTESLDVTATRVCFWISLTMLIISLSQWWSEVQVKLSVDMSCHIWKGGVAT